MMVLSAICACTNWPENNKTTDYFDILIVMTDSTLPLCVMNKRKQPHAKVYDLDAGNNVS